MDIDTVSQVVSDSTAGYPARAAADSSASAIPGSRTLADAIHSRIVDPDFWIRVAGHIIETLVIIAIAWIVTFAISRTIRRWMRHFEDFPAIDHRRQRALTIGNLTISTARYVIWPLALITAVSEFGVNIAALIATAGFAGLAIGFGAQTLVRDVISGFFLLFDDTIHVGDNITFNGTAGVVEHVGVRLVQMRCFDGELVMIPAGELRVFGNRSVDFARVLVEIGVSYEQDTEQVLAALATVASEWADEHRAILLDEEPEVQAIQSFGDSSVNVRVVARVQPGEQWQAARDLRRLIKKRFDEHSIEIPFPRTTVYVRNEPDPPPRLPGSDPTKQDG